MSSIPPSSGCARRTKRELGIQLTSAFQPIISVVHSKIVGHEALLRGEGMDGATLTPAALFPTLEGRYESSHVNELCAKLHLKSFAAQEQPGWLFLNVSPHSIPNRAYVAERFGGWLKESGLRAHQVVAEIIETRAADDAQLDEAVAGFRDLGCLVAIDDFGAGESNFERVWRLRPDVVKFDRAMVVEAAQNPLVQRLLPRIVALMHEAGSLVVMEGIETEHQALIAVESEVDFVQGYFFARPHPVCDCSRPVAQIFDGLSAQLKLTEAERQALDHRFYASFHAGLEACVSALEDGIGFEDACAMLQAVAGVQRVFELDQNGRQVWGSTLGQSLRRPDMRFLPTAEAKGANWSRRPYFRDAIESPGKVQTSRPYLSIADARSCVTISLAFRDDHQLRVICADLDVAQVRPPSHREPADSHFSKT